MQRIAQQIVFPGVMAAEAPQRPGWALPGGVGPHMRLDLRRGHAFVVVPGAVVGAHMLQAEPPVIAEILPRLRRPVLALRAASGHVAGTARRGRVGRISPGSRRTSGHGTSYVRRFGRLATGGLASRED